MADEKEFARIISTLLTAIVEARGIARQYGAYVEFREVAKRSRETLELLIEAMRLLPSVPAYLDADAEALSDAVFELENLAEWPGPKANQ